MLKVVHLAMAAMFAVASSNATAHEVSGSAGRVTAQPGFSGILPNVPGKSLKTVIIDFPPGGEVPSHRHAPSAFIFAYVLEGEIVNAVDGEASRTYKVGETWTENPGAHHTLSFNASKTKPAKLLAVFVVDTNETTLTTPDRH